MSVKRSRLKLAAPEYKKMRIKVFARDGWKCRICGTRGELHAHHVVFRSQGGDDMEENMLTVCYGCHDAIHDRWMVVKPVVEDGSLNANEDLTFEFVNGWLPRRLKAKAA